MITTIPAATSKRLFMKCSFRPQRLLTGLGCRCSLPELRRGCGGSSASGPYPSVSVVTGTARSSRRPRFDLAPGATGIMLVMTIQAVVFDIGGVLEITPDLGVTGMWESRLGLAPGELNQRMHDVWRGGSIGTVSEREVHQAVSEILGLDERQLAEFMADLWREYLGTANAGLIQYARRLRPPTRTGILSNSFVGAREREQAAYGFEDLVDEIIYSHECGMSKPDPGIYALACERLGVEPAQMVFLDDSEPCVQGARRAGIHAILYQDNSQAVSDIEDLLAATGCQ
jgi:HAD superfamily hydrolase (TIGR01509 family)